MKELFDFAIAGPAVGFALSFILLWYGLDLTASTDLTQTVLLPSLPVQLLKASALGGGLIDWFLGEGALTLPDPDSVLPLHPYAISGYLGLVGNALALLPIGSE